MIRHIYPQEPSLKCTVWRNCYSSLIQGVICYVEWAQYSIVPLVCPTNASTAYPDYSEWDEQRGDITQQHSCHRKRNVGFVHLKGYVKFELCTP